MRLNTMITLGASAAFGLMAVFLARSWINGAVENEFRDTRPETTLITPEIQTIPVIVANVDLSFGDTLTEDNVRIVQFPDDIIPYESFENFEDLFGPDAADTPSTIALTSIRRNEPVLPHKISGPNGKGSLSARIRPGYRAASIRVDAVTGVSGFIVPGDLVDVIYTATPAADDTADIYRSDIILQSVQVLGIDQNLSDETSEARLAKTVTLEVNHEEAQRLSLATQTGHLSLILRSVGEDTPATTQSVTTNNITQRPTKPRNAYPKPTKPKTRKVIKPKTSDQSIAQVTIIRGEATESVSVLSEAHQSKQKETSPSDTDLAGG